MIRFDDMNVIDITAPKQLLTRRRDERYLLLEYPELQDIHDRWARLSTDSTTAHAQGSIRQDHSVGVANFVNHYNHSHSPIHPSIHPVFA